MDASWTVLITSINIKTAANHLVLEWKDKGDRKIAQLVLDPSPTGGWCAKDLLRRVLVSGAWKLEQVSTAVLTGTIPSTESR